MSANEIIPNLWIGNIKDSHDPEFMKNIDVVINCTKDIPFFNNNKKCVRIPIEDNLEKIEIANMYKYLDKITEYIHTNLKNGKRVLVHCFAGKQRSATVVAAYLMRYTGFNKNQVSELLKTKRIIIFEPLCNFDSALKVYEQKIN